MRLKLASFAFEINLISNWFEAQIKFTWGSIKVYVRFTSDSNEAQFDFFYVLLLKRKWIRIYTSYKSKNSAVEPILPYPYRIMEVCRGGDVCTA